MHLSSHNNKVEIPKQKIYPKVTARKTENSRNKRNKKDLKDLKDLKNLPMSEYFFKYQVLPLKVLCRRKFSLHKGHCDDILFIKQYHSTETCADFKVFNTEQLKWVQMKLVCH